MEWQGPLTSLHARLDYELEKSAGRFTIPELAAMADIIHDRIVELFESWEMDELFQYYLEEAPPVDKNLKLNLAEIDPQTVPSHLIKLLCGWREAYATALEEPGKDWGKVFILLKSFSKVAGDMMTILKKPSMGSVRGVENTLTDVLFVQMTDEPR